MTSARDDWPNLRREVLQSPAYHFQAHQAAIKLDQNEYPLDLPEPLRSAALARIESALWHRYPAMHADDLAARIAERHRWPADGVVVSAGSNVLIQALIILSGLGREVVALAPSFSLYAQQARLLGVTLTEVPLGAIDPFPAAELATALGRGAGVAFLPVPLAPTGEPVDADALGSVVSAASAGWSVVVDEAYGEFAEVDHHALAEASPRMIRLRTLSKAYGLAGVRLGYALAHPAVARELRKVILPFSISSLQLAVAHALLDAPELVRERVAAVQRERERVAAALRQRGVPVRPSATNFLLVSVDDPAERAQRLREHGILVRRQDHLPGLSGALRVSIGTPTENDALLNAWDAA